MSLTRINIDHELLSLLPRLESATVQDLCDALGVTATAVRQRLNRLQAEGFVEREVERRDRGRPCHVYKLTAQGVKSLGDDHAEIAAILWKSIAEIDSPAIRQQLIQSVKNALVRRFGSQEGMTGSLVGRLQTLCEKLSNQGFDVELAANPEGRLLPIIREHNCPYHELVAEDSTFCELEQSVFSELLGVPVELSSCRVDGDRCCEFSIATSPIGEVADPHF